MRLEPHSASRQPTPMVMASSRNRAGLITRQVATIGRVADGGETSWMLSPQVVVLGDAPESLAADLRTAFAVIDDRIWGLSYLPNLQQWMSTIRESGTLGGFPRYLVDPWLERRSDSANPRSLSISKRMVRPRTGTESGAASSPRLR